MSYDGGSGGHDTLELINGSCTTVNHTFVNPHDGSVDVDGLMITYTGLEPIIDNLDAEHRIFTFTGGAESVTLSDDADAGDGESLIDSTLGESVLFTNPTSSLTVNASSSDDVLNIQGLDSLFSANMSLASGDININGGIGGGTGNLVLQAGDKAIFAATTTSTYTGTTTLVSGTTLVNGTIDNSGGTVTVQNGATLGGTGTVDRPVVIQSGGTVAPGLSPGILNTEAVAFTAGSAINVELNSPYATAGVDYDQLNVTGTVNLDNATLNLAGGAVAPSGGKTLIIINNDGIVAVHFPDSPAKLAT